MNFKQRIQTTLRHRLRQFGQHFPQLRRYSGRLGLGRMLTRGYAIEQIRVDDDVLIELDLSVPQFRQYYFLDNQSTALETILLKRLLKPTDTFVDVGAHIGYFTLVAAKYARQVIGFEPSPETFVRLEKNVALNPVLASKITLHNLGLSDHSRTAVFHLSRDVPGGSSLQPVEFASTETVLVRLDTLDQVVGIKNVAFIKIDVEGAELDVLHGGQELIRRNRPLVLCELFDPWQKRFGRTSQDIVDFFSGYGYIAFLANAYPTRIGRVSVKPLKPNDLSGREINNGLFIPSAETTRVLLDLES